MNILIPDSWLREFVTTSATPKDIQTSLSLCGPSIERLNAHGSDYVYDVEVTTNRVDCMSIMGIAREAIAILPSLGHSAKLVQDPFAHASPLSTSDQVPYLQVKVDPQLCPRFSAALVEHVQIGPSPDWLVKKLEAAGFRSLNNVVDISNLLMHELGQPVHTFDYDKITQHKMALRESKSGEQLTTLDGQTFTLPGHDLVIEDGSKRLIDLCGIMGGANSAIDIETKNVLLFVQNYEPTHIRRTSMSLGLRTQAAVLFEKGLSPQSVLPTLAKGLELLHTLAGGTPSAQVLDIYPHPQPDKTLTLTQPLSQTCSQLIGVPITAVQVKQLLKLLNFDVVADKRVTVPWYRHLDVDLPQDLVEEVARLSGYHNLPSQLMSGPLPLNRPDDRVFYWESRFRQALKFLGFTEAYTYSLVPHDPDGLKLKNPLSSDWVYLRTRLTPSHQAIIDQNLGRVGELNFFELANVYLPHPKGLPHEHLHLVISTTNTNWLRLKGLVTELFNHLLGITVGFNPQVEVTTSPTSLIFEISLTDLLSQAHLNSFTPISKYAPLIEDFNLSLTEPYPQLEARLKKLSPLIQAIKLIDHYQSKITVRLTFHSPSHQLTSDDIAPLREQLVSLSHVA